MNYLYMDRAISLVQAIWCTYSIHVKILLTPLPHRIEKIVQMTRSVWSPGIL